MRIAALLVALFTIAVGIVGIVAPDSGTTLRRLYYATPGRFYTAGAFRLAMGLVLILAASTCSRWPRTLRALGAMMCLQALAATLFGLERARAIMEWEAMEYVEKASGKEGGKRPVMAQLLKDARERNCG